MRSPVLITLFALVPLMPGCVVAVGNSGTTTTVTTNMHGDARRTDTLDLALSPPDTVILASGFEDVRVRRTSRAPRVVAELRVIAYSQEEAEQALEAFRVAATRSSRGLELTVVGDAGTYETEGGARVPYRAFVSLTIEVPAQVKVIVETSSGETEIRPD